MSISNKIEAVKNALKVSVSVDFSGLKWIFEHHKNALYVCAAVILAITALPSIVLAISYLGESNQLFREDEAAEYRKFVAICDRGGRVLRQERADTTVFCKDPNDQ